MFMSRTDNILEATSVYGSLPSCESLEAEGDEEADSSSHIVYTASFDELADKYLQYDTIIWISISLLLVLAWGFGVILLLYMPYKRHVLRRDIFSRKLYVTSSEIVYKVCRPSYIPFWRLVTIEKRVPLCLVIDIIIEQGCLESVFELHTFRVESISRGGASHVDELHVQGVSNPTILSKVILSEASKSIVDTGRIMNRTSSLAEKSVHWRSSSKNWKGYTSPHPMGSERIGIVSGDQLLRKIDEVNKSVKRIESLVDKSQKRPEIS